MQSNNRYNTIMLVGSLVLAIGLVSLIPYYGLVGGHAEHGVAEAGVLSTTTHRFVLHPDGVDMVMTAATASDTATITAIQTHMQTEATCYRAGDYADTMGMVSAELSAQLKQHQADIAVTVVSADASSTIQLRSHDASVVTVLTAWAEQMRAIHMHHSLNP